MVPCGSYTELAQRVATETHGSWNRAKLAWQLAGERKNSNTALANFFTTSTTVTNVSNYKAGLKALLCHCRIAFPGKTSLVGTVQDSKEK